MEEALGLYRGDLLPSFFIPETPEFEAWLERQRARMRSRAAEVARLLTERHEAEGHLTQAIECARQAVELSNGDERPLRWLIELLDRLGDRAGALRAYDNFARRLATELEAEPSAETVALIERVRSSRPPRSTPMAEPPPPRIPHSASDRSTLALATSYPVQRELGSSGVVVPPATGPATVDRTLVEASRRRRALPIFGAAIAALGILAAVAALRFLRPKPAPELDANLVAVAPFDVLDPVPALWREGIVDILSRNLDGAGPLRTVSPTVAIRRWRGRAEAATAQALGRQTGARLVVFGHVIGSGADSVRLKASLVDARTGRTLGEVDLRDAAGSAEAAGLVDTVEGVELWLAMMDLANWPDSGETSIRLARALLRPGRSFVDAFPASADSISRQKMLARLLAFRGHLQAAYRMAPPYASHGVTAWLHPFLPLALLGVVPRDSAAAVFGRMLRGDALWPPESGQRRALPWWNAARDTASLARFAQRADSAARRHDNPVARAHLRSVADAARAYSTLVKGDSSGALRAFSALPDSLCVLIDCFYEKLTQTRLAAALGQDQSAAEVFDRWLSGQHLNPVGVLGSLERGRVAERLGQRDKAIESYRFVADVWRNADSELQPYVAEAREGLKRMAGEMHSESQ